MQTRRSAFLLGVRAQAPMLVGMLPFAFITGAASTAAGLDPWLALAMSIIVYAGASQLAAISLIAQGAPAFIVVATVLVVNLRMMMYSAAMARFFRRLPTWQKWAYAYGITDHIFAMVQARYPHMQSEELPAEAHAHAFYAGIASTMWLSWQGCVAIGIFAGTRVPKEWPLDFAIPLVFAAILFPALMTRTHWIAALVASVAAACTATWPLKLGLMSAAIIGMVVGGVLDAREHAHPDRKEA
jgi:predicted branched-subunit amino acid permease